MVDEEEEVYTAEDHDDNVYEKDKSEDLAEGEDEVIPREQGFIMGYEETRDNTFGTKNCQNCGSELDIEDKICPVCGTRVEISTAQT